MCFLNHLSLSLSFLFLLDTSNRLRHPNIVLVMGVSIVTFPKPAPPPGFDDDDMVMGGGKDNSVERTRSLSRDRRGKDKDKNDDMIRSICIITEYLEQGSLADILYGGNRVSDEFWTYELVLTCALQAARGMLYLHSHQPPICHRDLKSSNLVVDDHWVSSFLFLLLFSSYISFD